MAGTCGLQYLPVCLASTRSVADYQRCQRESICPVTQRRGAHSLPEVSRNGRAGPCFEALKATPTADAAQRANSIAYSPAHNQSAGLEYSGAASARASNLPVSRRKYLSPDTSVLIAAAARRIDHSRIGDHETPNDYRSPRAKSVDLACEHNPLQIKIPPARRCSSC